MDIFEQGSSRSSSLYLVLEPLHCTNSSYTTNIASILIIYQVGRIVVTRLTFLTKFSTPWSLFSSSATYANEGFDRPVGRSNVHCLTPNSTQDSQRDSFGSSQGLQRICKQIMPSRLSFWASVRSRDIHLAFTAEVAGPVAFAHLQCWSKTGSRCASGAVNVFGSDGGCPVPERVYSRPPSTCPPRTILPLLLNSYPQSIHRATNNRRKI